MAELSTCFQSVYFSVELARELRMEKRYRVRGLLERLEEHAESRIHIKTKGVVSTQDNLNSDALSDVCMNLGLDYSVFKPHEPFLDKVLMAKRNCIAHGENIFITADNVDEVCDKVISCIDIFRSLVENAAVNREYQRQNVA